MTSIQPDVPDSEDQDESSIERDEAEASQREAGTAEQDGARSSPVIINRIVD